ncbi:uncharacterized protein LOC128718776 [Anopheles marshallii]|uniref:uncharacterized protein LOC128718776 n=1 Tax=Anopheles marshallii TaxID=1521116 RepID=UPI00237B58EE|nr:uncharacterized protein LOC128718776 [Anopheles marshallii]
MSVQPSTSKRMFCKTAYKLNAPEDVKRFIELVKQHPRLLERISLERLLPEWEKLVPETGVSASFMISKWNRLCAKYRSELRLQKKTQSGMFKSNWTHFDQMAFARAIEEKRMRVNKRPVPVNEVPVNAPVKVELVTPPSSPKKPRKLPDGQPCSTYTKPSMVVRNGQPHVQTKTLLPIEKVWVAEKQPKLGFTEQAIIEDLQQQAARTVASRGLSVHRMPITNLSVAGMRDVLDNDFDFLMIRIYPLLSAMPSDAKQFCYERMQRFVVNVYKNINQTRCKNSTAARHIP